MNEIVELLAHLDWFERLDALLRSLSGQKSWEFCVPRNCGWSGIEMERLLRRHGVKIWDRDFTRDCLTFRVKRRQANWAEYLLRRRGIPVVSRSFNPLNDKYARHHAPGSEPPTRQQRRKPPGSLLDELIELLR